MDILIGCEESQEVCKAFRAMGHSAFSCDLKPCSGGRPEWHLQMDVFKALELEDWEMLIAFPPCTYVSRAGARWLFGGGQLNEERYQKGLDAKKFFLALLNAPIERVAIENPTPLKIFELPKQSQVIQPYQYGHEFSKRTLLWLKNLPELNPTDVRSNYKPYLPSNTGGKKRGQAFLYRNMDHKQRSKTFPGIARAMAEQWG